MWANTKNDIYVRTRIDQKRISTIDSDVPRIPLMIGIPYFIGLFSSSSAAAGLFKSTPVPLQLQKGDL